MKTIRKIFTLIVMLAIFSSHLSYGLAEGEGVSVTNIDVEDTKSISVTLDREIAMMSLKPEDVKIMHDIVVSKVDLDISDAKKVSLTLESDLLRGTEYNLISVFGVEGSMDFETTANLEKENIVNTSEEGIKSIMIIDATHIDVFYHEAISTNEVELKLLEDISINSISNISNTIFQVGIEGVLQKENNYIFMLLSAQGTNEEEVEVKPSPYNFETTLDLQDAKAEKNEITDEREQEDMLTSEKTTDTFDTVEVANDFVKGETIVEGENIEMNSASEGINNLLLEKNIEVIAAAATEVPETGAATNMILLLTFSLSTLSFIRRRKV